MIIIGGRGLQSSQAFEKFFQLLKRSGLDEYWLVSVSALVVQELYIKRVLLLMGLECKERDFQMLAEMLAEEMERRGIEPPKILLSVIRSYRHIRASLIHDPNKTSILPEEALAIVNNTYSLINAVSKCVGEIFAEEIVKMAENDAKAAYNTFKETKIVCGPEFLKKIMNKVIEVIRKQSYRRIQPNIAVFLKCIIEECASDEKVKLTELLVRDVIPHEVSKRNIEVWEIMKELTKSEGVRELFRRHSDLVDLLITGFSGADNFRVANEASKCLDNLFDELRQEHLRRIVNAFFENNQLRGAWEVQNFMRKVILQKKEYLDAEEYERLKQALGLG